MNGPARGAGGRGRAGVERLLLELEEAEDLRFPELLRRLAGAEHAVAFAAPTGGRHRLTWSTPLPDAAVRELRGRTLDPQEDPFLLTCRGRLAIRTADLAAVPFAGLFPEARWALVGVGAGWEVVALLFGRGEPPTALAADPVLAGALLRRLADRAGPARDGSRMAAEVLSRLSHEFKTPLVSIKGYAELILDSREPAVTPQLRDWARRIATAANRLTALYRRATSEPRAEAGWGVEPRPGDAAEWVRRGVEEAKTLAVERRLQWSSDVEQDLGPVALDPEAARDLLLELLQNAARGTPDGGEIRVRLVRDVRAGACGVRLAVTDTGVGIPGGEAADRLFEPFATLGRALDHHSGEFEFGAGGLGLGLPLVRGVARALGGEAWAEGRGRDPLALPGCAFHVWLPEWSGEPSPPEPVAPADLGNLLVVEPDPEARRILETALSEAYAVRSAADAAGAVALWSSAGPWAGCIVDPQLPEGGGVELLRVLRTAPGAGTAPIVVYTATAGPGEAEAWRAAGADSCVWKPARTRVLVQRLHTLRARRSRR